MRREGAAPRSNASYAARLVALSVTIAYFSVGIANSAPVWTPTGQRVVTVFVFV